MDGSNSRVRARTKHAVGCLVVLMAIGVIVFLATRSSPWLSELAWMPDWLGKWADRHGNFRNFPAFAALAVILALPLGWWRGAAAGAGMGIALELVQLGVRGRSFDWADIVWSVAGAGMGGGLVWLARRFRRRDASLP